MLIKRSISRRTVLRGIVGGMAVNVGVPLLDCFLNENGTAMANEAPMPVRFGTWFWGLGMDKGVFIPKKVGTDYDLPPQIASWKDVKQHVNLFTNFNVFADGKPAGAHFAGWVACLTGSVPSGGAVTEPTLDVLVADTISGASRFRSISCAASGSISDSYSMRSSDSVNPPEVSAIGLYQALYGPDFQDPNSPDFKPRPSIMLKESVLSGVREDSSRLMKQVGAADRARMDQYFTSLREAEQRLEQQLQKPPAAPSCRKPEMPAEIDPGTEIELVTQRHKEMANLLAMGLACNQTRVFTMAYSNALTGLSKKGLDRIHHAVTHEEAVDEKLGYQPTSFWFLTRAFESYAYFIQALASVPEGSGTLLDNCAVFSCSDSEFAKNHSIAGIPMMLAGKAGGRLKTGYHVDGKGTPVTHVGYTALRAMNVPITEWGTGSQRTTNGISEILV